jgi:hypothetical protein
LPITAGSIREDGRHSIGLVVGLRDDFNGTQSIERAGALRDDVIGSP